MSKKLEYIKKAVFYSQQKPQMLAELIAGTVTDVATSVSLTGATEVAIPTGDTATTETYTASILSQYGDAMTGTITWSVTSATGVSISNGVLSVGKTASAGTVTVTATSSGKSASIEVTLKTAE